MSALEIYLVVGIRIVEILAIAGVAYIVIGPERLARWLGLDQGDQDS